MSKQKFHVKKGDSVRVITGEYKGKEGTVVTILPAKQRVVLSGFASNRKRAVKPTQNNPGGMVDRAVSTHISNVKKIEKKVGEETDKKKVDKKEEVA
jgi:large subunit ribosomal protein L24